MTIIRAEAAKVIDASPEAIYAVLADYHVGHKAILPQPFFEVIIEKGGQGAGTLMWTHVTVFGKKYSYHQLVSEPEPGRVIKETDIDTGQFSSFTLDPLNGGKQTRVTIHAEEPAKPGIVGFLGRFTQPPVMRRMFMVELNNLAAYVRNEAAVPSTN